MDVYKATQLSRETGPLPFHAKTLLAFPWNRVQFDQYCIELVGSVAGYRSEVLSPLLLLLQGRKASGHSCSGDLLQVGTDERERQCRQPA